MFNKMLVLEEEYKQFLVKKFNMLEGYHKGEVTDAEYDAFVEEYQDITDKIIEARNETISDNN